MFRKLLHLPFCLVILLTLVGCGGGSSDGGGGGDNPPTSANVRAAGQQIVDDTKAVWGSSEGLIQPQLMGVLNETVNEVGFGLERINLALYYSFEYGVTPILNFGSDVTDQPYDGVLSVDYTVVNSNINGNDTIDFTITNPSSSVNYHGTLIFPHSYPTNPDSASQISLTLTLADDYLTGNSSISGTLTNFVKSNPPMDYPSGIFHGTGNFYFNNGKSLVYSGDYSVPPDLTSASGARFSGSLEASKLKINGVITANGVNKSGKIVPCAVQINGTLTDKTRPTLIFDGSLSCEVKNAQTVEFEGPYSATNWIDGSFSFSGKLQNGQNKSQTTFTAKQTAYNVFHLDTVHQLTGNVNRQFSLSIDYDKNKEATHLVIDSTWGPSTLIIDGIYGQNESINGEVDVNGTKVGTLKYDSGVGGIKISYNDGSFETF